jgi:poly(A) polymerase
MGGEQSLDRLAALAADLAAALGDAAADTWLVGGVVRDALLGRDLPDVDLVVRGDAQAAARRLARAFGGTPFPLGEGHGCWRVARSDGEHLDVCTMRGDGIDDDLRLRDLTINAIAAPVLEPARLADPLDGQGDLIAGVVRMVRPESFDDDPLRMLRAARFAHVLGMQIEPATEQAIRQRAAAATQPSGERTFAELCAIVESAESRRGVRLLDSLGLVEAVLPELHRCKGIEQSRFHHLDVYEHTLAVLDNVEDLLHDPRHYLPDDPHGPAPEQPFGPDAGRLLRFAAIAHDLGKPDTHGRRPDGRVTFIGHDARGVELVDGLCDRWATSNAFRSGLRLLVGTHLALGMLLHTPFGPRERYRFLRAVQPHAPEAIVLSMADRFATAGPDDRRRWVRLHHDAARQLWWAHWREQAAGPVGALLDGTEIAEACGVRPGPQLGELVRALAEEQAVGAVATREEAVEFVRGFSARAVPAP